jgi:hypothetical protein
MLVIKGFFIDIKGMFPDALQQVQLFNLRIKWRLTSMNMHLVIIRVILGLSNHNKSGLNSTQCTLDVPLFNVKIISIYSRYSYLMPPASCNRQLLVVSSGRELTKSHASTKNDG